MVFLTRELEIEIFVNLSWQEIELRHGIGRKTHSRQLLICPCSDEAVPVSTLPSYLYAQLYREVIGARTPGISIYLCPPPRCGASSLERREEKRREEKGRKRYIPLSYILAQCRSAAPDPIAVNQCAIGGKKAVTLNNMLPLFDFSQFVAAIFNLSRLTIVSNLSPPDHKHSSIAEAEPMFSALRGGKAGNRD